MISIHKTAIINNEWWLVLKGAIMIIAVYLIILSYPLVGNKKKVCGFNHYKFGVFSYSMNDKCTIFVYRHFSGRKQKFAIFGCNLHSNSSVTRAKKKQFLTITRHSSKLFKNKPIRLLSRHLNKTSHHKRPKPYSCLCLWLMSYKYFHCHYSIIL